MTITLYENTFADLNFANSYFQNRPNSDIWTNLSDSQKESALVFSTTKINNFIFIGNKKSPTQNLEFPRDFVPELPVEIQKAVCEEALAICENSVHQKNRQYGISSVTLGASQIHYFDKNEKLISQEAMALVSKWTAKNFDIR